MVFNEHPTTWRTRNPTHLFPFDLEPSQFEHSLVASVSDFSFPPDNDELVHTAAESRRIVAGELG
jgi:hypothetical protein